MAFTGQAAAASCTASTQQSPSPTTVETVAVHFKNLRTNTCTQSASDTFFRYFYLHFPSPFAIGCFTYIVHLFEQNKHVFSKRYKKMWLQYKKRQLF